MWLWQMYSAYGTKSEAWRGNSGRSALECMPLMEAAASAASTIMDKTPSTADEKAALTEQMDNAAFERDANGASHFPVATTVEMGEFGAVPGAAPASRTSPSYAAHAASGAPLCKPDLCRAMLPAPGMAKSPALRPNPWHRNKTILLVATIVGLVIWAVAYFALQKTGIL